MRGNMPGGHTFAADGESLQADVMRFMAIIAFCLIAILALVRNAEPPAAQSTSEAPATGADVDAAQAVSDQPVELALAPTPAPPADPVMATPLPVFEPSPRPERLVRVPPRAPKAAEPPSPEPVHAEPVHAEPVQAETVETPVETKPKSAAPNRAEPEPVQPERATERGLSLRFASDRDFMRLITKGEIQVYAFQAGERVLGLAKNYEFAQAPAPGRLYELLPETIPRMVMAALERATRDADGFAWGIRLPADLEAKIRAYVDRDSVGELIIDRYGEVHHRAGA